MILILLLYTGVWRGGLYSPCCGLGWADEVVILILLLYTAGGGGGGGGGGEVALSLLWPWSCPCCGLSQALG